MSLSEKIEATLVLSSFCETLGFHNGIWEFNFKTKTNNLNVASSVNSRIIHQLISFGGISQFNFTKFNSSDDTLLIVATCKGLIKTTNVVDNIKKEYIKIIDKLKDNKRASGIVTIKNIENLINNISIPYSKYFGGNGATIRAIPIGLVYYNNLDELIKVSIKVGKLTHNYILGYMGSFIGALFTSYAIQNIMPWEWVNKLLEILLSNKMTDYMISINEIDNYQKDIDIVINLFSDYQERRINKFLHINDVFRLESSRWEFLLNYSPQVFDKLDKDYNKFGSNGIDVIIIALDALLSAVSPNKKTVSWETLVYLSSLHFGDNDSTGALAGAWYGALFGYRNTFGQFDTLEFIDEIKIISKNLNNRIL